MEGLSSQWKCSIDLTRLVIGWPKAKANTATHYLLTVLTVLMTAVVFKEIKVIALFEMSRAYSDSITSDCRTMHAG